MREEPCTNFYWLFFPAVAGHAFVRTGVHGFVTIPTLGHFVSVIDDVIDHGHELQVI